MASALSAMRALIVAVLLSDTFLLYGGLTLKVGAREGCGKGSSIQAHVLLCPVTWPQRQKDGPGVEKSLTMEHWVCLAICKQDYMDQ